MTEQEIKKEVAYKQEVVEGLQSLCPTLHVRYKRALDDTDKRLGEYVDKVISHPDDHNLYELLAVRRFFLMLDEYDWSVKRVRNFIRFYEALKFNGTHGRQRYKLTPIQCFQFANMFGFLDKQGRRLVGISFMFVPR